MVLVLYYCDSISEKINLKEENFMLFIVSENSGHNQLVPMIWVCDDTQRHSGNRGQSKDNHIIAKHNRQADK